MIRTRLFAGCLCLFALAAPTVAQQPVVLKFSSPAPVQSVMHPGFNAFIEHVNKASGGALKVEPFYGATLGNFAVTYDRVVDGVADFGFMLSANAGGKFKLHDVASLPFETEDAVAGSIALWNLYAKGVTAAEYGEVRPVFLWAMSHGSLFSRMPIRTLEDMKGKKVSAYNVVSTRSITALALHPAPG